MLPSITAQEKNFNRTAQVRPDSLLTRYKIIKYRSDDVRFAPPRVSRHLILSLATSLAASCAIYPTPKYVAGYDIAIFHNDDSKVSFYFCPRRRKLTLGETPSPQRSKIARSVM